MGNKNSAKNFFSYGDYTPFRNRNVDSSNRSIFISVFTMNDPSYIIIREKIIYMHYFQICNISFSAIDLTFLI